MFSNLEIRFRTNTWNCNRKIKYRLKNQKHYYHIKSKLLLVKFKPIIKISNQNQNT